MPGSRIDVTLAPESALTREGAEHVELALAAAADQPFRSLATTASGGELSRVMLACRSVLTSLDRTPTLVFDEIDAGIGGRAGLAVGRRLAKLARDRQVLVVTHLPQIACFADRHIRITKEGNATTASTLDDRERVAELARMLAGLQDSSSAHTHARELLEEADRVRSEAIGAGT
jgi:DNA repair protein RecN (Recombination protein N)